ncbi:HTTM domain-containing protein [Reichenbachiella agarivorans]|uniref:HTTM domain-containing protein n=1 Tax=Reichenbachiella agarivorans TaxID=2979464 RepID=A0ABY6CR49_9BACT|nr:HTTM domain-containing protein [Reichenbachiella agarivorans]UXP32515.1 HTTM domain-containing protein [Reichenbachiella agarivorans]
MFQKLQAEFYKPIDNSPIVLFRILFGLLMAVESFGAIATGWVKETFVDPNLHFPFIWLDWLKPLSGDGMYYYYAVMGLASLLVMIGYRYRWSALALALLWSGCYFMQKTHYNNHYYLAMLLCWYMVLIDPRGFWSVDSNRSQFKPSSCPNWYRQFFILQFFIFFSYASVAKFSESWISGDFINMAFSRKGDYFLIGPLLVQPWFQYFIVYSGIAFDALISPLLLWKRSRWYAFTALILFNLFNSAVFQIGIFPYMVIALAFFFFEPEKIRQWFFKNKKMDDSAPAQQQPWIIYVFALYFAWQLYLPLRHLHIAGDVLWREEGHRLSWRMMLRNRSGSCQFVVKDGETGEKINVQKRDYLSNKQISRVNTYPDFAWQFAQHLKEDYLQKGMKDPQVYCLRSKVKINRGEYHPLINPETDLANVSWNYWGRNEWVLDKP